MPSLAEKAGHSIVVPSEDKDGEDAGALRQVVRHRRVVHAVSECPEGDREATQPFTSCSVSASSIGLDIIESED